MRDLWNYSSVVWWGSDTRLRTPPHNLSMVYYNTDLTSVQISGYACLFVLNSLGAFFSESSPLK
jgi:hypothetical protein